LKFEIYILKQLALAFTLAVGGMLFVALPGIAVAAVHKLSGVDLMVVLRFLPLLAAGLVPYVMPIGFLLAVVVTYGRLAADREWTAMIMAGRNPLRMLLPAFLFGVVLAAGTYGMVGNLLPYLKYRTKEYRVEALSDAMRNLSPGRTEINVGDFYLSALFRVGDSFFDALVSIPGQESRISAKEVRFTFDDVKMVAHLRDFQYVEPGGSARGTGESLKLAIEYRKLLKSDKQVWESPRYKSSSELWQRLREEDLDPRLRREITFQVHNRMAISATFFMFLMLGVANGLIMRKGTQLGAMAIAVGYALIYYVLSMRLGKELALSGAFHPALSAWMVMAAGSLVGALMLRKALRQ
jgi:lipopolysaccharide export system permease protein